MTLETILVAALLALFIATLLGAVFLLLRSRPGLQDVGHTQALLQLQQQITDLIKEVQETARQITIQTGSQLQSGTKALTDLVQSSQDSVTRQVTAHGQTLGEKVGSLLERLATLDTEIRHLSEIGQDLRQLQDILKTPKVRGGFGEQLLENLLRNILPPSDFAVQHSFQSGEMVDAVIKLPGGLVPVDAKFPLENFRRILASQGEEATRRARRAFLDDIRRHGQSIAAKYVRPAEGTLDLALMYVPAENVYYEAFVLSEERETSPDLWQDLLDHRVFPVSPNTFSLYLKTLHLGLRGMRVEEGAQRIVATLAALKGDLQAFRESFEVMARHLTNALKNLEETRGRLDRFDWRLRQVEAEKTADLVSGDREDSAG